MSDEGERTCPLCTEEMDLTDRQLKPCKCGYEGHRLIECGNFSYWYGAGRLILILCLPRLSSSSYWFVL
ncbi:hypothetical protein ACJW30_05G078200 [Castanea mollissima]